MGLGWALNFAFNVGGRCTETGFERAGDVTMSVGKELYDKLLQQRLLVQFIRCRLQALGQTCAHSAKL